MDEQPLTPEEYSNLQITTDWLAIINACEVPPRDLNLAVVAGGLSQSELEVMLDHAPTVDGVLTILAMRPDALALADRLARLATRRDERRPQ